MKKSQISIARLLVLLLVFMMLFQTQPAAYADRSFDEGIRQYKAGNYKAALADFQKAMANNRSDANPVYYYAITAQRLGDKVAARDAYARLVSTFQGTDASRRAAAALAYLDPKYYSQIFTRLPGQRTSDLSNNSARPPRPATANSSNELDKLPAQSRVYFENAGNNLLVDVYINNRPIKMFFDSGASEIALGKNHLRELGIRPPEGPPDGASRGVGSGGIQPTWKMNVTIKVGQIERTNFPITVQEDMPVEHPLLGQTFFRDFHYTIDNAGRSILFTKTGSGATTVANASNSVPFRNEGREVIVSVEVNGRAMPMYFDTGAEYCAFSFAQLKQLGVEIPEDAQQTMSNGIAGSSKSVMFNVPRMKLGPIEKQNVTVTASNDDLPHPLLGQSFFGDLRYEFDNQSHVLMIRR